MAKVVKMSMSAVTGITVAVTPTRPAPTTSVLLLPAHVAKAIRAMVKAAKISMSVLMEITVGVTPTRPVPTTSAQTQPARVVKAS
jgi:hypothetical protein